jgi:selenocysteine lyase/cysteine desulfurase/molybdopterin-guanine dinucleotide biosynthesis protein A
MAGRLAASGVVLAGGRSRRFGRDKLAAELAGEPLLYHVLRAVSRVCEELIIVGAPDGLPVSMPAGLPAAPVVLLDPEPYAGPLVALAHAARRATHRRLLLVGGDMPELQEAVLRRLLVWPQGRQGACLVRAGSDQPLPLGLDRAEARLRAGALIDDGQRSLRALVTSLDLESVPEQEWRTLDPEGRSLRDVDRPADLSQGVRGLPDSVAMSESSPPTAPAGPRAAFDLDPDTTYLDAATFGLPPRATVAAMQEALAGWSRGTADWVTDWDRPAEATRASFADLVGVPESTVALHPTVSVGVGLVAATLRPGDEVIVPDDEFTSVLFPLLVAARRGVAVRRVPIGELAATVTPATRLVATSLVQMQTGRRADLPAIREAAERVGARILLDATQAIPFLRPDEDLATIDLVVIHGYKHLLCPRGAAFMVVRADRQADLAPLDANWRSAASPYGDYFAPELTEGTGARRFDISLAWLSWVGAAVSIDLLRRWRDSGELEDVWARAHRLADRVGLGRASSTLVAIPVADPPAALAALSAARVKTSVRGGSVRLSVHLWNDDADIDRALEIIAPYRT